MQKSYKYLIKNIVPFINLSHEIFFYLKYLKQRNKESINQLSVHMKNFFILAEEAVSKKEKDKRTNFQI